MNFCAFSQKGKDKIDIVFDRETAGNQPKTKGFVPFTQEKRGIGPEKRRKKRRVCPTFF
jgi:hypothetical protein